MRVSKAQVAENRARLLAETARMIREAGIAGSGVDALARAAGFTHGSLYSQFGSKERLVAEALAEAMAASDAVQADRLPPGGGIGRFAAQYLSPAHRDRPGTGCALAAIGPEAAREGSAVRSTFTAALRRMAGRLAAALPLEPKAAEPAALASLSTLVGALILARAVDDPELSDRILAAGRSHLSAGDAGGA
ncbi:TetR/AcrR family transcriptional regulator [Belnapia rosea]|uniref:Transcriptional regulator, TetR family n=2 Tax=Belnapia rosea TaxID=938405 RepID=A0A1G6TQC2_9PROT|nr:TetR/AcrR family transcriptional regulator [Belnapia rosea]SDB69011.1 transcriptional regulator, TetR family [Belnapia rosea]SDD31239.1 transcriptional regulator, TetR family [Belnapia rosea]